MSGKKDKISLPNFLGSVVSRVKKLKTKSKRKSKGVRQEQKGRGTGRNTRGGR
jgi:hypothetical protein